MATYPIKQTYDGNNLMIFYNDSSWAWATSHSLSISCETVENQTKDTGKYSSAQVSKITHEITTENLYCTDYDTLFSLMIAGEPITLKFGLKKDEGEALPSTGEIEAWTPSDVAGSKYYESKYLITSLTLNANTGETATYSATFTGVGKIEQKTVTI